MNESIIRRFQIIGLNNYRNVNIYFDNPYKILVGENGLGKTKILTTLYYLLTNKWLLLSEVVFDFIELQLNDSLIEFTESELHIYIDRENEDEYSYVYAKFRNIEKILKRLFEDKILFFPVTRNVEQQMSTLGYKLKEEAIKENTPEYEKAIFLGETMIKNDMQDVAEKLHRNKNLKRLNNFKALCNKYLVETKFYFNNNKELRITNTNKNEEVELEYLSSGEKQMISIFSKILLSNTQDLIILIDEPELSLSINWQRTILQDIVNSNNCAFLLAITHSPFVFDNELDKYAEGINIYFE